MASNPPPPAFEPTTLVDVAPAPSSGFWDKLSDWAAKNKALVYSIAGVAVVVTGAGAVYYLRNGGESSGNGAAGGQSASKKKKSRSQRRKEKKKADESKKDDEKTEEGMFVSLPSPPILFNSLYLAV